VISGTNVIVAAIGDKAGNVGLAFTTVTVSVVTSAAYQYSAAGCMTNAQYVGSTFTQTMEPIKAMPLPDGSRTTVRPTARTW
jgi:hypothetical protein